MMPSGPTILVFRRDLRLADNAALTAAMEAGRPVVPVYILDEEGLAPFAPGGASRWWLHHSLASLDEALRERGSRLVLRRGATVATIAALVSETKASAVHLARSYEPAARRLESDLRDECKRLGVAMRRYPGALLHEPEAIATKSGTPFRVFTPFWRACQDAAPPQRLLAAPSRLPAPVHWPSGDELASWRLLPSGPDWSAGLRASWRPGEPAASERLARFVEGAMREYSTSRDHPAVPGTSRLSPCLQFGEVSPRQCWHAARLAGEAQPSISIGAGSFLRELGWREFSQHLLFHYPAIVDTPFRADFADFPWRHDDASATGMLAAWQRGRTGYPIVDAGMRELWQTGWMHNRVRMIVASFLTKHMLVSWQDGARWFWDTLVDADLASNQASWQWVAGCGADAAPYFRIFNPVLQGTKFDPDGDYVRRFVPELAQMPPSFIHSPWRAPAGILEAAGVQLGRTYPLPIVDHEAARQRALDAYRTLRSGGGAAMGGEEIA